MKTIIIVAMTRDRVIGKDGTIPWCDPEDMRHFKQTTTGHAVIMGRKTYESIGKPLPNRRNIVITRKPDYVPPTLGPPAHGSESSIDIVSSLDDALKLCRDRKEAKAFIIGGAQIYQLALPIADEMIVTHIDQSDIEGDTYFPPWNDSDWSRASETDAHSLRIATYRRTPKPTAHS